MKEFQFDHDTIWIAEDVESAKHVGETFERMTIVFEDLPRNSDAQIVIKPNLNNDLSALTGNSADLRVLVELIKLLQQRGYRNLTIADGPNVGIYRKGADVFGRLGVRRLAEHFGVNLIDLNHSAFKEVEVQTGKVRLSELCLQADYLINVPKIKTHAEAGMSVAVKNLMGCVIGTDTRIIHQDLGANLVRLNQVLKPNLILVDGLIGMEGNGPGDGDPRKLDLLLAGKEPFVLDSLVAKLMGLESDSIPYLRIAKNESRLIGADLAKIESIKPLFQLEPPPKRSPVTKLLEHRALGNIRDATRFIHGSEWARKLLYRLGIMQDVYEAADAQIETLTLDSALCDDCGKCLDVCPTQLPITNEGLDFFAATDCLGCLYCALVCPQEAIQINGELGYLGAHLARYGEAMRS